MSMSPSQFTQYMRLSPLSSLSRRHSHRKLHALLHNAELCSLVLASAIVSISGCDPVRTITHSVTVAVVDEKGVPAPNVNINMKESWESWQTWGRGFDETEKAHYRQNWESDIVPWRKGATNTQGRAVVVIEDTALDRTRGKEPPTNRDMVSNREYIIKLQGQNVQDEVRLVMKPVASVKGKFYTLTVINIEKPRYIESRWERTGQ
jgi:hypothetical protein